MGIRKVRLECTREMSCSGSPKEKYESALAQRFLEETYGSEAIMFVFLERPDLQRPPRNEGWPDFIYDRGQDAANLVIELGRWIEGEEELWFEKRVESFGDKLRDRLRGRLPGFYIIEFPYDLQLPKGRGKVKRSTQLLDSLAHAIICAASQGVNSINSPVPTKLIKIDRPGSDVFVTPMKQDFLNNDNVLRDPIYLNKFKDLLIECNCKLTGFEDGHNVLVLDTTESKMDLFLLTMLAQREWDLDNLIPALAPRLREIHLCEGMRVWSGAGGRQLRHKYQGEVSFTWMRLWPGRMAVYFVEIQAET